MNLLTRVRFLRRPVGPRPATLMSGLQLQKRVGPVGRQLYTYYVEPNGLPLLMDTDFIQKIYIYSWSKPTQARDVYPHNLEMSKLYQLIP